MAFTTATVSSISDLFTQLDTFLLAQGWSTDLDAASGQWAAWKNVSGSVWVTMAVQWDTGSPEWVGVYQWHGAAYSSASDQWAQNDDSGNGEPTTSNSTLDNQRNVYLDTCNKFWCFEDTNYFHIVVRYSVATGGYKYMHFGSGYLDKYSDWTGGEYCYGQLVSSTNIKGQVNAGASYALDGLSADSSPYLDMEERVATLHIEGMNDQAGTSKWGVCMGNQSSSNLGTDRGANARIHIVGGFRSGPFASNFGTLSGSYGRGLVPLYPIVPLFWNRTTDNQEGPLGVMPDVRGVSLANFEAEDSVTVGSDTWVVFPTHRRLDSGTATGYTGFQGLAYKQVS